MAVAVGLLAAPADTFAPAGSLSRLSAGSVAKRPVTLRGPKTCMTAAVGTVEDKPWMTEAGARAITNAEVMSAVAVTGHLAEDDLKSWLMRRGYSGATLASMFDKLIVARNGGLELSQPDIDLDKAANMFVQAEIYEEEGQKLEEEANKIVEEAQTFGPEILELTEKIKELEASLAPWEWVGEFFDPTFGDRLALQEAQARLDEITEKRQQLDEKIEEVNKEASEKMTNCNWDREDAGILRNNALKALADAISEEDHLLDEATSVIEKAEQALISEGSAGALQVLMQGTDALENISLRPDKKASPASLPGRLHTLLSAPSPQASAAAASSQAVGWTPPKWLQNLW